MRFTPFNVRWRKIITKINVLEVPFRESRGGTFFISRRKNYVCTVTNHFIKKVVFATLIITGGLVTMFNMSSCQKTDITPPYVFFDTATGYIGVDTALPHGTIFTLYVTAEEAGMDQLLTTGTILRSVNGGPDSVLQTMSLATQQFNQFYSYVAGPTGTRQKYIFSFGQLNGLTGSDSITITSL